MEGNNNAYTQTPEYKEDLTQEINQLSIKEDDTRKISNNYQAYNEYLYSKNPKEEEKTWADKIIIEKKQQINYEDPEIQKNLPLWLQKGHGEEEYITPLWKRKLAELESPFINDTIKGIIADCVESKSKMRLVVRKELDTNGPDRAKFHRLNYLAMFYDEDRFLYSANRSGLTSALFQYFGHSNAMIHPHVNQDDYYTESDPFMRLFDKKINSNIPQTQMETNKAIRQIQEIFRIEAIENTIYDADPDQLYLNYLSSETQGRTLLEMQEIKPLFMKETDSFFKENYTYKNSINGSEISI
jgi:hypothetical protein